MKSLKKSMYQGILFLLLFTMLGCSKSKDVNSDEQSINSELRTMNLNTYKENDIAFPEEVVNGKECFSSMVQNPDSKLEMYTYVIDSSLKAKNIYRYILQEDGTWSKGDAPFAMELMKALDANFNGFRMQNVNNDLYLLVNYGKMNNNNVSWSYQLYCTKADGSIKEIKIPDRFGCEVDSKHMITNVLVYADNTIIINSSTGSKLYNMETGQELLDYKDGVNDTSVQDDNELVTFNMNDNEFTFVNKSSGEVADKIKLDIKGIEGALLKKESDGEIYFVDENGINRLSIGKSTYETILDANQYETMNNVLMKKSNFFKDNENFYVLYDNHNEDNFPNVLKKYVYSGK